MSIENDGAYLMHIYIEETRFYTIDEMGKDGNKNGYLL